MSAGCTENIGSSKCSPNFTPHRAKASEASDSLSMMSTAPEVKPQNDSVFAAGTDKQVQCWS